MSDFNQEDYESTVEGIAEEALRDYSGNGRDDFIYESVDGNSYIIYYAGNDVVKKASSNYGNNWREIHALAGDNADDDKLKQVAAYEAMIADVYDKIQEMELDWTECDQCGKWFDPDDMTAGGECEECKGDFCNACLVHQDDNTDLCKDCNEDKEPTREEEDGHIYPSGSLGSRTSAGFNGKFLGEFSNDEEALQAIREAGREANYFPNVWNISDHGNEHLIEDFSYDG